MSVSRLLLLAVVVALPLAACSRDAPSTTTDGSIVALTEAEAAARLDAALRVQGLLPATAPGGPGPVAAVGSGPASRGWADCPRLRLTDPSPRMNRSANVAADMVATRVVASLQPASPTSTRVALQVTHEGSYLNPFTNTPQRAACPSTGSLERTLLASLAAGT